MVRPRSIIRDSYLFLTERPCREFEFSSTGGISEHQPDVIGSYILTSRTQNERPIYEHENGELYLYSLEDANPTLDGAWMVNYLKFIIRLTIMFSLYFKFCSKMLIMCIKYFRFRLVIHQVQ